MEDADLLIELATLDEVSAEIPTSTDHDMGVRPQWCELVLAIKREEDWPLNMTVPLRRHDGELIIQVLHDVLHPDAYLSAGAAIWDELDMVVDRIQRRVERGKEPLKRDVGQAQGLTKAIAIMDNPVEPDEDDVRAVAMERYELRHGISAVPDDD